jgi:Uma2 family endonuclease
VSSIPMTPPHNVLTLAGIDALAPGIKGEIIEGVLYTMPRPRAPHQSMMGAVGTDLLDPFQRGDGGPGGWWIPPEPGIELPNTPEIAPAVAGWRRERLPALSNDEAITVVPDWVCEILSPTTEQHNLTVKKPYYAKVGVAHHWIVDLSMRTVIALRLESGRWREVGVYGDEREARIEPFAAVPLNVASWWD